MTLLQFKTQLPLHAVREFCYQDANRPPRVLLCVEDVHEAELLSVVLEALGWQTIRCDFFEWLAGWRPTLAPDLLAMCTWPLRDATIAHEAQAQLARSGMPLVLLLDREADRNLMGVFHAVGAISPLSSLDEIISCFERALHDRYLQPVHPRLLIVEEYMPMCLLLRLALERNYEIVGTATDGATAVAAEARLHPDLMLMDYYMPLCDGIEAARQIKQHARPPKIVLFTSEDIGQVTSLAAGAGIDAVVQKNGDLEELEQTLARVMSRSSMVSLA